MDPTIVGEFLAGILIFAAANIAYFEIRKVIQFFWSSYNKSKHAQDH
ncbi:MAG TPA: hypothetical protein VMA13_12130 [Candidatus Saccharimonadales bacterium]|nr:hypothetical protein [Candidatus Saccharimonadales bacterium]